MAAKSIQGYFRTNYQTLSDLIRKNDPDLVIGFLVLARFCNGNPPEGIQPHSISCAGANAMKKYCGLSEPTAKGVIDTLVEIGVIVRASAEQKAAFVGTPFKATYGIIGETQDFELPNTLVEGLKGTSITPPLRRVRDATLSERYAPLTLTKAQLRLDMLSVLLCVYRNTSMLAYGGVSPRSAFRKWNTKSKREMEEGHFEWMSEPDENGPEVGYIAFMKQCLPHISHLAGKEIADDFKHRFWNAWGNVRRAGLVYEAVSMYDGNPEENPEARLLCTLRVNDFHADSDKKGVRGAQVKAANDLSLITSMKGLGTRTFHFYTNPEAPYDAADQSRQDDEQLRLSWPDKTGHIVGIWRPRFRAINPDTGAWMDAERTAITTTSESLLSIIGT